MGCSAALQTAAHLWSNPQVGKFNYRTDWSSYVCDCMHNIVGHANSVCI